MSARRRRTLTMLALVTAGETVFLLAFMFGRLFRPTLLDVFGVTNFELGLAYSVYGFVAMGAYLLGGPLADRFSARWLMAVALATTGAGGAAFVSVRSPTVLMLVYGWWGLTTILLFWAALIRATRQWGGEHDQGRAFGFLDGGRGLVAAVFASALVALFSAMLPEDAATASLSQRTLALERSIWLVTGFTVMVALLVLWLIPDGSATDDPSATDRRLSLADVAAVARRPAIWMQALIVVCAYVGYKSIDDVSLYARDAFGYDDVEAANLVTVTFWMRPIAAVTAGLLADRTRASTVTLGCFSVMALGNLGLALDILPFGVPWVLAMTVAVTTLGIYGLRGLYFALFGEARVPLARTGSAVGLISLIGYTPDVFMGPLMGWLTDRSPGALGHQHLYGVTAMFGALGWLATVFFRKWTQSTAEPVATEHASGDPE